MKISLTISNDNNIFHATINAARSTWMEPARLSTLLMGSLSMVSSTRSVMALALFISCKQSEGQDLSKCLPHHRQAWAMLASTQAVPMWCTTSPTSTKVWNDFTFHWKVFNILTIYRSSISVLILSFWALSFSGSIPSVGRREKASSGSPGSWSTYLAV